MEINEIKIGVLKCLGNSLAISTDEIKPTTFLIKDLGVDSLDILDISFSLEKEFNIKLRGTSLDDLLKMDFTPNASGLLSETELKKFRTWMPALSTHPTSEIKPVELFNFITVESLILLIQQQLQ
jgi:acyl carrier protein